MTKTMTNLYLETCLSPGLLEYTYTPNPKYKDSIFEKYLPAPPKVKGALYEKITEELLLLAGGIVSPRTDSSHDCVWQGVRCELKGSTEAAKSDQFTFNQIRPEDDYEKLILTFLYPDKVSILGVDKSNEDSLLKLCSPQHRGKRGEKDTYLLKTTEAELLQGGLAESIITVGAKSYDYTS